MSSEVQCTETRIHVWHVVGPMNRGGAESMVMELLRHKSKHTSIKFLVHQRAADMDAQGIFDAEILSLGSEILPVRTPVQIGLRRYLAEFRRHIRNSGRPDVIHIHLNARSGIVVLAAKLNRIPRVIVHSHAALTFRGSIAYRLAARLEHLFSKIIFAAFASDFWGCSNEALDTLFPRWSPKRQSRAIINNAINVRSFLAASRRKSEARLLEVSGANARLVLGTVGRLVAHKNCLFLLDIVREFKRRGRSVRLIIAGREDDINYVAEIRRRIAREGLDGEVSLLGDQGDIPSLMASFDVFVSAALREGFGLVAAEAQAAGLPCVVSSGFPKSVDMGLGLAVFLKPDSPAQWVDVILSSANWPRPSDCEIIKAFESRGFSSVRNTAQIEQAYRNGCAFESVS